jgi:hypothetical protein
MEQHPSTQGQEHYHQNLIQRMSQWVGEKVLINPVMLS